MLQLPHKWSITLSGKLFILQCVSGNAKILKMQVHVCR